MFFFKISSQIHFTIGKKFSRLFFKFVVRISGNNFQKCYHYQIVYISYGKREAIPTVLCTSVEWNESNGICEAGGKGHIQSEKCTKLPSSHQILLRNSLQTCARKISIHINLYVKKKLFIWRQTEMISVRLHFRQRTVFTFYSIFCWSWWRKKGNLIHVWIYCFWICFATFFLFNVPQSHKLFNKTISWIYRHKITR